LKSVDYFTALLIEANVTRAGVMLDNGLEWVALDLACMQLHIFFVPVPVFFSHQQVCNTIASASLDLFICETHIDVTAEQRLLLSVREIEGAATKLQWLLLNPKSSSVIPNGTDKITFTSGSTGTPKGVCLSTHCQLNVAHSLVSAVNIERPKHLCLLSLSVLLENIAGLYVPLLAGGMITLLPQKKLGFDGSQLAHPELLLASIVKYQPNSLILVPALLLVITQVAIAGWQVPKSLKFIAVGGAKVSPVLLKQARQAGLPVFQCYGLSECASVIALSNQHSSDDTVGKLLPHSQGYIEDGVWCATANLFLGYLNQPDSFYPKTINTGDRVTLSNNNELSIIGRSKNLIINSFGRNIQPEWIEAELMASGLLSFVAVIGESQPTLRAVLLTISPAISDQQIQVLISQTNATLPDYGRVAHYVRVQKREDLAHLLTANQQPNRLLFEQTYNPTFAATAT
jgi:long-chain acyl-CoA synthetase